MASNSAGSERDRPLTGANSAKLHCLRELDALLGASSGTQTILDLGCGTGANFLELLRRHPQTKYVGVEPSADACARARSQLAGFDATIVHQAAYDYTGEPAAFVVSFSVLEHVYRRERYLACASRNLAAGGLLFINYDAGHFSPDSGWRDRVKGLLGRPLAALGYEGYFQALVRDAEFHELAAGVGLEIVDSKFFNSTLKEVQMYIPARSYAEFLDRWLDFELFLNQTGLEYRDTMAHVFRTRNFILRHRRTTPPR